MTESDRGNQYRTMAHLRDLPKCSCGKAATVELFSGVNAPMGKYCGPCGRRKLREFKEG